MTERIDSLIIKLTQNTISENERTELEVWRNSSAQNETYYNETIKVLSASDWKEENTIPEMTFDFSEIEDAKRTKPSYLKYVASILFVIVGTFAYLNLSSPDTEVINTIAFKSITLPDSSVVTLNKDSKLIYNEDFNSSKRSVMLIGQAFFNVKKSDKPFIIHAYSSKIEVLGTSFDVRTNELETEVQVSTGKVRFSQNGKKDEVILTKQNSAHLTNGKIYKNENKLETYEIASWKSGFWKLRENNLVDFLLFLEKEYNSKLSFDNAKLKTEKISGLFKKNSLKSILEQISELYELDLQYKNDGYILKGDHETL